MNKSLRLFVILSILVVTGSSNVSAISKVAARYNVIEFYGLSAQPIGSYDRIGIGGYETIFDGGLGQTYDIDADDLYENSVSIGFNYGSLINDLILVNFGLSYTNALHKEEFEDFVFVYAYPDEIKLRLYNLDFNLNRYFISPVKTSFSPYVGVGLQAGLLSASAAQFTSESDIVLATSFNFGADLTVWQAPDKMAKLNLSSVNSYQIYASDSRPKYMTLGLGLKYYFRP